MRRKEQRIAIWIYPGNKQAGTPPIDALFLDWSMCCRAHWRASPLGLRQAMPKVHFSICAQDALTKSKMWSLSFHFSTPKSSILMWLSIINQQFLDTPIYGNPQVKSVLKKISKGQLLWISRSPFFLPVPQVWTREAGIQATATVEGYQCFRYVARLYIFSLSLAWHGIDLKQMEQMMNDDDSWVGMHQTCWGIYCVERSVRREFVVRVFRVIVSWRTFSDQSGVNFDRNDTHFTINKVGEVPFDFELVGEDEACRGQLVIACLQWIAQGPSPSEMFCAPRITSEDSSSQYYRLHEANSSIQLANLNPWRDVARRLAATILQLVWTGDVLFRNLQHGSMIFLRHHHFSSACIKKGHCPLPFADSSDQAWTFCWEFSGNLISPQSCWDYLVQFWTCLTFYQESARPESDPHPVSAPDLSAKFPR